MECFNLIIPLSNLICIFFDATGLTVNLKCDIVLSNITIFLLVISNLKFRIV